MSREGGVGDWRLEYFLFYGKIVLDAPLRMAPIRIIELDSYKVCKVIKLKSNKI